MTGTETPYPTHDLRAPLARPTEEDRTWAGAAHGGALAGVLAGGLFGVVAPITVLLARGQDSPYVRRHASAALNFQLTALLVAVVGGLAGIAVTVLTLGLALIVVLPAALAYVAFALVVMVLATVRAVQGEEYRYPLSIPFVR
ncbi:DUF4870 domain-containing protein [Vallicoccus soli]|nr:DUF4870 domain-containing protein [Vallicoccus soli]